MDLVNGAKQVVVVMEHTNKHGEFKIKRNCSLPLTGEGVVHRLITEIAVFDFTESGMMLVETMDGVSITEITDKTDADFSISSTLSNKQKVF